MDERQDEQQTLELVTAMSERLRAEGVSYCHFKSNEALERSLSGENDLDLLIARGDAQRFETALAEIGFLIARPKHDRVVPGVTDHYGMDPASERLVHVHAHYQLFVGDDTTKNYRLAIEDAYLSSVDSSGTLPIPDPSFEFVLFVLRMVMKHFPFDAQLARKGKLTRTERRELDYLLERMDPDEVTRIVDEHLEHISTELFEESVRAVKGEISRVERALLARRLVGQLDEVGRRPPGPDVIVKVWRRTKWRVLSRFARPRRKRPDRGGLFLALVGGDGSGKSSAVEMLETLLARDLDSELIHLGKPERSTTTRVVKWLMARARNRGLLSTTRLGPTEDVSSIPFPGYGFLVWHLLTARDRYRTYMRGRRLAASGVVVISDRFPLSSIRSMDAPRTRSVQGVERRRLARWLIARETAFYERIGGPDLLLVLKVDPDVAVRRRAEQDPEFVRTRANEVWQTNWDIPNCVVIDANEPIADVHAAVRRAVWSKL